MSGRSPEIPHRIRPRVTIVLGGVRTTDLQVFHSPRVRTDQEVFQDGDGHMQVQKDIQRRIAQERLSHSPGRLKPHK